MWPKIKTHSLVFLLPARKRKIHSKMKVLPGYCVHYNLQISHCKYMQIFYDGQGQQLTPQSEVVSGHNIYPLIFKMLKGSLLHNS